MIVPGGGISLDGARWISSRPEFLLPVRVLGKLFRRLFLTKLERVKPDAPPTLRHKNFARARPSIAKLRRRDTHTHPRPRRSVDGWYAVSLVSEAADQACGPFGVTLERCEQFVARQTWRQRLRW